jgi:hypothetical protein
MGEPHLVETADRYVRKRAVLAIVATLVFLGIQLVARPAAFAADGAGHQGRLVDSQCHRTAGGPGHGRGTAERSGVRALGYDELSRSHLRTAVVQGYWVAMGLGLVLYLVPRFRGLTSREAIYLIVPASLVVPPLTFARLERRALKDG